MHNRLNALLPGSAMSHHHHAHLFLGFAHRVTEVLKLVVSNVRRQYMTPFAKHFKILSLFSMALITLVCVFALGAFFQRGRQHTRQFPSTPIETKKSRETQRFWYSLKQMEPNNIEEISVKLGNLKESPPIPFENSTVTIRVTDRSLLWEMATAMTCSQVPLFGAIGLKGVPGGDANAYGTIYVKTKSGTFYIGMTPLGFTLNSDMYTTANCFWSWGLAKHIDDLLFENTGKRLPENAFMTFSGEGEIESSKERYHEYLREIKGKNVE